MIVSDEKLRAQEYERKRNTRLVRLRREYKAVQETLADVENQLDGTDDFRLLKRIGGKDISNWKAIDKKMRVELLRFRSQSLERGILAIVAEKDAGDRARGSYVGPMIHPDPTPQRF